MQNETLPGVLPTARLELEVLLGPGGEIITIGCRVEDPTGHLIALRQFPISEHDSPSAKLDIAWRTFLNALPTQAYVRETYQKHGRYAT